MFILGFEFDRDAAAMPGAGQILQQTEASSEMRLDMLRAIVEGRLFSGPDSGPFFP